MVLRCDVCENSMNEKCNEGCKYYPPLQTGDSDLRYFESLKKAGEQNV